MRLNGARGNCFELAGRKDGVSQAAGRAYSVSEIAERLRIGTTAGAFGLN